MELTDIFMYARWIKKKSCQCFARVILPTTEAIKYFNQTSQKVAWHFVRGKKNH